MRRELQTENAKIGSTSLGLEDHGILTFWLFLEGGGWGCGFGGLCADGPGFAEAINKILETLEISTWEKLPGTFVRAKSEGLGGRLKAVGHLLKDRWVTIEELAALLRGEVK